MEKLKCPSNWWVGKQHVVSPYNGILFDISKDWSTDTFYIMDVPWNHYAKWKKPVTKDHTYIIPLFEVTRIGKSIETENILAFAWDLWG
jgi:hypothetical protein